MAYLQNQTNGSNWLVIKQDNSNNYIGIENSGNITHFSENTIVPIKQSDIYSAFLNINTSEILFTTHLNEFSQPVQLSFDVWHMLYSNLTEPLGCSLPPYISEFIPINCLMNSHISILINGSTPNDLYNTYLPFPLQVSPVKTIVPPNSNIAIQYTSKQTLLNDPSNNPSPVNEYIYITNVQVQPTILINYTSLYLTTIVESQINNLINNEKSLHNSINIINNPTSVNLDLQQNILNTLNLALNTINVTGNNFNKGITNILNDCSLVTNVIKYEYYGNVLSFNIANMASTLTDEINEIKNLEFIDILNEYNQIENTYDNYSNFITTELANIILPEGTFSGGITFDNLNNIFTNIDNESDKTINIINSLAYNILNINPTIFSN
jgi:hypothetical protein